MRFIHQLRLAHSARMSKFTGGQCRNDRVNQGAKYVHHRGIQSSVKGSCVIFGRRKCVGGNHVVASPRTHQWAWRPVHDQPPGFRKLSAEKKVDSLRPACR